MESTTRIGLPLMSAGQSQKEVVHNEALLALDALIGGCVEEPPRTNPPSNPQAGQSYIVEQAAVGDWAGLDGKVVSFTPAGWRAQNPFEGQSVRVRSTGVGAVYHDGAWEMGVVRASSVTIGGEQVVGSRTGAISSPTGGTIVDVEGRACLGAILNALRTHGLIASS